MAKSKDLAEWFLEFHNKQSDEIRVLEKALDRAHNAEKFCEMAVAIRSMYDSYIAADFTEEQAWKLTEIVINNATKK